MPRLTKTDDGLSYPCPECNYAGDVWQRTHPHRDYDNEFRCHKCGHEFDTKPDPRPPADKTEDADGLPIGLHGDVKDRIRTLRGGDA